MQKQISQLNLFHLEGDVWRYELYVNHWMVPDTDKWYPSMDAAIDAAKKEAERFTPPLQSRGPKK